MSTKEKFIRKLEKSADRHDPYVWGGQGEKLRKLKVLTLVSMAQNLTALLATITFIFKQVVAGVDMSVCKIFDCSGLITYYLMYYKVLESDTTAQGLYRLCLKKGSTKPISEAKRGDLIFCGDAEDDINHVGCYLGNDILIEARGSKYGVVRSKLSERDFKYCGDIF